MADNPALEVVKALPLTFYSRIFYAQVVRKWTGVGAGFFFFVTALGIIALCFHMPITAEDNAKIENVFSQMPEATIKDHKLTINAPAPATVKIFDTTDKKEANSVIFDPNYKETDTKVLADYLTQHNAFMLITSTQLISASPSGVQIRNMDTVPDGHFTHDDWMKLAQTIESWIGPVIIIAYTLVAIISNIVFLLIGAVLALVFGLAGGVKLDFAAAMRLAAAAAVPACLIAVPFALPFGVRALIWIGYAIFAVISAKATPAQDTPAV